MPEETTNSRDDLQQEAEGFIRKLVAGDVAGARGLFDADLLRTFPEARLKDTWLQLTGQVGAFQKIRSFQTIERPENRVVVASCKFERAPIDLILVFNRDDQVSGLNAQPVSTASTYHPPGYVDTADFRDVEVMVGSGEWALPATLSVPLGSGPFPSVVLVHGSGPQDRDETIGPNKPFRDLAWGLASQGIAVLRYEKRTKVHGEKMTPEMIAQVTVQDEVVDDALLAIALLRQTPEIDSARIYVLAHSLGATLAPWIGQQDPPLAGLIILAGMTRRFEDTILDQYTYIYSLSGALTDWQKSELAELREKVDRVKDPNLSNRVPAKDLPLNVAPAYWLSLRGYRPEEVAKSLAMRIFVLQGGRDYQVTAAADFPAWQDALRGKSNATLKLYPKLNHEFIVGKGPSTPQEYLVEGHVSDEVVRDIARWIKSERTSAPARTLGDS